jgi:hypothetical protein
LPIALDDCCFVNTTVFLSGLKIAFYFLGGDESSQDVGLIEV